MIKIYPSLMAADTLNLEHDIKKVETASDGFHIDVMDHHFVPNLTFGPDMVNAVAQITQKQLWLHLMIEKPHMFLDLLKLPPNTIISFHKEVVGTGQKMIEAIKKRGWLPSIAINPATDIESILPILPQVSQVLVMTVEPGFYGQDFLPDVLEKLAPLKQYKKEHNLDFSIGMDGGINLSNVAMIIEHGVDDLAIGSAIFKSKDPALTIEEIRIKKGDS